MGQTFEKGYLWTVTYFKVCLEVNKSKIVSDNDEGVERIKGSV